MPSINDWTAKAARRICDEPGRKNAERIAAIIAVHAEPLVALLREARRPHYHCDDSWYCCGRCQHPDHTWTDHEYLSSHDGEAAREAGVCNCGADAWNARIDKVLGGG